MDIFESNNDDDAENEMEGNRLSCLKYNYTYVGYFSLLLEQLDDLSGSL